jgi:hypothetical protein
MAGRATAQLWRFYVLVSQRSGRVTGDGPGHPPTPPDVPFSASGD